MQLTRYNTTTTINNTISSSSTTNPVIVGSAANSDSVDDGRGGVVVATRKDVDRLNPLVQKAGGESTRAECTQYLGYVMRGVDKAQSAGAE